MTDPRIDIRESLALQLQNTRETRDLWWETYWQRRRVVVVPENGNQSVKEGDAHHAVPGQLHGERGSSALPDLTRPGDEPGRGTVTGVTHGNDDIRVRIGMSNETSMTRTGETSGVLVERRGDQVIRDCIARLKAARDKDSTNRNLSTLLAVVVKVQRDLEALLNGSTPR